MVPEGKVTVLGTLKVVGLFTVMLSATGDDVCGEGLESVTVTVKLATPATVGVPEITPVLASSVSPPGSAPEVMLQVYGDCPPVTPNVVLYGVPSVTAGSEEVVMDGGVASIIMLTGAEAVRGVGVVESVTINVNV